LLDAFRESVFSPHIGRGHANTRLHNGDNGMGGKVPHKWKVEQWTRRGNIERLFAECDTLAIGIVAYDQACRDYPLEEITLRHGSQVIRTHPPDYGKQISRLPAPERAALAVRRST
jgi:hypothetical protein